MSNEKITFNLAEAEYLYFEKKWSAQKIADLYGFKTYKSVLDKLKAAGHIVRSGQNQNTVSKSLIIDSIFKDIDSDVKAYILGLFLGDSALEDNFIRYIRFDNKIYEYISTYINCDFKKVKSLDLHNLSSKPGIKEFAYISEIKYEDVYFNNRFIPQYSWENFKCNLSLPEMKYVSSIMRGIFDSSGTFGFPSNKSGSIYFRIQSSNRLFIYWCKFMLEVLGMRNLCENVNIAGEYEIYSAQNYNIEILLNSVYQSDFGCKFKKDRLLNVYNIR